MPRESKLSGGFGFWLMIAIVVAVLFEGAIAFVTMDDCGEGVDKTWSVLPPEWECKTSTVP